MALGRVIMGVLCLAGAGVADAAAPRPVRLALILNGLETGPEVSWHPNRWLTIRRSIAFVRTVGLNEIAPPAATVRPRPKAYALTGDIHPFRTGFRISLGLREDRNRQLLRASSDAAEIGTQHYAPMASIGFFGEVAEGLSLGGDIGVLGDDMVRSGGGTLVTPIDRAHQKSGYRPVAQLSMSYRY